MVNNLKQADIQAASKLFGDAMTTARSSLEQILQSPITIKQIECNNKPLSVMSEIEDGETVHVIKTGLLGQLKGMSYLIFSENDVTQVCRKCLPENILDDPTPQNQMMITGFLSEVDNMLSAAVVTKFADILNMEIYGGVPNVELSKAGELMEYLESELTTGAFLHFQVAFHGPEMEISPDFFWILPEKFVHQLEKLI